MFSLKTFIVLALTFSLQFWIDFLIWKKAVSISFSHGYLVVLLSVFGTLVKKEWIIDIWVYLWVLCSIALIYISSLWWNYSFDLLKVNCSEIYIGNCSLSILLFLTFILVTWRPYQFNMSFRIRIPICANNVVGILLRTVLLFISLWRRLPFYGLPIHTHQISWHL